MSRALNWLLDSFHWMITLGDKFGGAVPEGVKQRLPSFLGLSLDDEQIYLALVSKLEDWERKLIRELESLMKDFEHNRWRQVVAGMPAGRQIFVTVEKTKATEKKVKDTPDYSMDDLRILFLKQLAKDIQSRGAQVVLNDLYHGRVILPDPLSQKTKHLFVEWGEDVQEFKKFFLDTFGVKELKEIRPRHIINFAKKHSATLDEKTARTLTHIAKPVHKTALAMSILPIIVFPVYTYTFWGHWWIILLGLILILPVTVWGVVQVVQKQF